MQRLVQGCWVPYARFSSDQPTDVHGSTSVLGEACGRALGGGARGSKCTWLVVVFRGCCCLCAVVPFLKAMKTSSTSSELSMVR